MPTLKATNNWVLIQQDEKSTTAGGFTLPDESKTKPATGTIRAIGKLVKDPDIKAGKDHKAFFPKGVGFTINYEGIDYLAIDASNVIAVV